MAIAAKDCERIAKQLVQNGMQLVRDVQIAYTNLALATEQSQLGQNTLSADRVAIVDDGTAIGRTPTVVGYSRPSGRAEVADEVVGPNFAELWISIDESADYGKNGHRSSADR